MAGLAKTVLVVNAGSSSLKLRVLDGDDHVLDSVDAEPGDREALASLASRHRLDAVGHRVVHGGSRFRQPVLIDDAVLVVLAELVPMAPLHQPASLAGIDTTRRVLPDVPAVACFDTAFHTTIPDEAAVYPLPAAWRERYGLRRYGFHGLSHAYAARRTAELVPGARRVVTCHLGAGSSLAAVVDGRCVDTTMGFTPNEGVPMATRSGSVDVGMLLWLLDAGLDAAELADGLQHRSGMAGLAGTADMAEVVRRADGGDDDAALAVDVWLHRVAQGVAAMTASAQGIDALAFTGGIGERAVGLRRRLGERLAWLGIAVDDARNRDVASDSVVSPDGAPAAVTVVGAREDVAIAGAVRALVAGQ